MQKIIILSKRLKNEFVRKQKIIDAAFNIFVEKKIELVSMGEIAEAAGMGRATLFRYYPSKHNDNFNNYVTHENASEEQLEGFRNSLYSVNTRFHLMYEKAKEDNTFRTDIPEDVFFRVTLHSMMAACVSGLTGTAVYGKKKKAM